VNQVLITIKDLSFVYPAAANNPVLKGVNLEIRAGERLALLGANGSGKSTLLNCLNGLLSPPPRTILIYAKENVLDPSNRGDLEGVRRRIATVLQNPDDQIISSVVEEDTAFGPQNQGVSGAVLRERVTTALERTGLEKLRERQVRFLSGGERQRLALAGVLALNTEIITLDEAVSMLDPKGRDEFLVLLDELSAAGKTILQVTHSLEEAVCCPRLLVLYQGSLVFDGPPKELIEHPKLETWGFALPEAVRVFRSFLSGFSFYSMDPEKAADDIAAALEAGKPGTVLNNNDPQNTENAEPVQVNIPAAANDGTAVSFIGASHRYSQVFPGGINNIHFKAAPGELIAFVGRSGSGKSTVLKHINALLLPVEGSVLVLGDDTMDRKCRLSALRMKAALSVQNPESALFERYVADDVAFGPRNGGLAGEELVLRVKTAMEKTGLSFDEFADRETRSLSGGEKRRTAIAGTAAMESEILLLDEPLAELDGFHQQKVLDLINHFRRAGKTVIISTHSMETAVQADKVGVMVEGKLAAFGPPREIFGPRWDPLWELSLPWVAAVSQILAARKLIPAGSVSLTAKELLDCLQGRSTPVSTAVPEPISETIPFAPRGRRRRRKTGIEFFRFLSFEELPSSPLQKLSGGLKLFFLFVFAAAVLAFPPPFFPLGMLAFVVAAGWFAGKVGPVHLLRGFFRILPWLFVIGAVQLAIRFEPLRPLALMLRVASLSSLLSLFCAVTPLRELVRIIPFRDLSLAAGIILRFIPILSEEGERIISAQLSRGGKKGRIRMTLALTVPLFLRALERSEALVKAMLLRGYH